MVFKAPSYYEQRLRWHTDKLSYAVSIMHDHLESIIRITLFTLLAALPALDVVAASTTDLPDSKNSDTGSSFNVWAAGDPHVTADSLYGIEPLRLAFRQSEGFWSFLPELERKVAGIPPAFDWDLMLLAGDLSSSQFPPRDGEGLIFVDQFNSLTKHRREDIFTLAGNHDAEYFDQGAGTWFQKWADPMGQNTETSGVNPENRRFKPTGTWERYRFQAGNILFLMLSDYNSAPAPVGRGHSSENRQGGYPAGAVTRETFNWWKRQVLENQDKIIITAHHHVPRDTTTMSVIGGGVGHHANNQGDFEGASFLYYTIENPDPDNFKYTMSTPDNPGPFEVFFEEFEREHGRPPIDFWIGAHTHSKPMEVTHGRGLVKQKWGVTFMQVAGLTRFHFGYTPMSWLLNFTEGSDEANIGNYIHRAKYYKHVPTARTKAAGVNPLGPETPEGGLDKNGWLEEAARTVKLRHPFVAPPPDPRPALTGN